MDIKKMKSKVPPKGKTMGPELHKRPKEEGGNLHVINSSEMAAEYGRRSGIAKRRTKERLASLRSFTKDLEKIGVDVGDNAPKGIDVLKFCMVKAMHDDDYHLAAQYAEKIAQYETPKLASQQVDVTTHNLTDLTDEEFQAALKELEEEPNGTVQ